MMETDTSERYAPIDSEPHGVTRDGIDIEWLPVPELVQLFNSLSVRAEQQRCNPNQEILTDAEQSLFDQVNEHLETHALGEYEYSWHTHQLEPVKKPEPDYSLKNNSEGGE